MIYKAVPLLLIVSFALSTIGQTLQTNKPFNPTGSYKLTSNAKEVKGETTKYTGEIKVKLLTNSRIAVSFYVDKGAPSYNSGSFVDTLVYKDNNAVYQTPDDTSCRIVFVFTANGITVNEKTADYNSGCGFGHAVIANGFYRRISSTIPVIKEPLTD